MKKRCIAVILLWVIITCFGLHIRSIAFADPLADALTVYEIGAAAYSLAPGLGIGSNFVGGANGYSELAIGDMIDTYVGESSIAEKFGEDQLRLVAGQLVIPSVLYNNLCDFWDWAKEYYDLDGNLKAVNEMVNDVTLNRIMEGTADINGYITINQDDSGTWRTGWRDPNGQRYTKMLINTSQYTYSGFEIIRQNNSWFINRAHFNDKITGLPATQDEGISIPGTTYKKLSLSAGEGVLPTVIDPSQQWQGQIGDYQDTNLDQLLGHIYEDVEGNNLDVDGEVIDIPVPPGPVPTWTPVDDVIDGINQMGEQLDGLGNDIGDISGHLDDMGDQIGSIEETLEGVQEGIQTQTGVVSGAIDQATSDVVDAIGEQTSALDQTLTETVEGVQEIAEALQPGQITPRQFDLRRLFPFCIPFDIHNLLQKFDAEPVAPHVQLPFVIQSIGFSYTFDLDFSSFNSVAAVMRTVEFIVFAIGLAWATSKVIKW